MTERTEIHLLDGHTLHIGQWCRSLHQSRWRRAKVRGIIQGTGVERAIIEIDGKRRILGRYSLKRRVHSMSEDLPHD